MLRDWSKTSPFWAFLVGQTAALVEHKARCCLQMFLQGSSCAHIQLKGEFQLWRSSSGAENSEHRIKRELEAAPSWSRL